MLRQNLILLTFLSLCSSLDAQDLHIHYNVFRDSVYYIQNGKPTEKPVARKGSTVLLHVENYNNYLYELSVVVEKEEMPIASSNSTNLLSKVGGGGTMPLNLLFKGADQMLGMFKNFSPLSGEDLDESKGFANSAEEKAHGAKVASLMKLETEFTSAKDELIELDRQLKEIQQQVQKSLATQRLQKFAVEEIDHIRYNPRLEPSQIKRMTNEYMESIFIEKDPNKIDLTQVLKIADAQTELPKKIQEYQNKADLYATKAVVCDSMLSKFAKFNFPESNLDEFQTNAEEFVSVAKTKTLSLQENATMLEVKLPEIQPLDPKFVSELRTTFIELNSNSFSKTYRHTAGGEKLNMKLKLTPIDSMERKGMKTLELSPVVVNVFGGMRVRASVGLNFGQFFTPQQSFFVRDSMLQSGDNDAFVPVVTSFVHFYAPSARAMSIAGSFGIGFPLGGGESLQSLSFFLGPSLLFGKGERIVLNAGIMGGKAERLSQGYQIGDLYTGDSVQLPTKSVYELGYYLGVSFNLAGGGVGN